MRSILMSTILVAGTSAAASANRPAADACAAGLLPDAKGIYAMVAPSIKPDSVIKDVVIEKVKPMVVSGKMTRDVAKVSAAAAGECLKLLK